MNRTWLALAGANGFLAVALGAFGAHGLDRMLAGAADAIQRLEWWRTAAHYQLTHALALGLVAVLAPRVASKMASTAGWSFQAGIVLFSGSLYAMTLTGFRPLGAVTPFGGLGLLVGWTAVVVAAVRPFRSKG